MKLTQTEEPSTSVVQRDGFLWANLALHEGVLMHQGLGQLCKGARPLLNETGLNIVA